MKEELLEDLAKLSSNPLGFVLWAFPWGEVGTELEEYQGPDTWQEDILTRLGSGLLDVNEAIRIAVASGHGVGKSALVSWIVLWAISTFEDTRGIVTANTENQLKTKTWVELAKWYRLFIAKELFNFEATKLYSADPEHAATWRIDMVPWSEKNTEAFAGLHNKGKRILVMFDEASAIPDVIHETTEGALTDKDTQIIWCMFGNPTRNTGRFRDCFPGRKFGHRWSTLKVDSRTVKVTNKTQFEKWVKDYGEDSDFVRIRVRGEFPRTDSVQFIPTELANEAAQRQDVEVNIFDPLILGVDVARFGDDASVIYFRKGRDGRTMPPIKLRNIDTMALAGKVAELYEEHRPDAVFVDGTGVGGGVVDRLRQLQVPVWDIQFGGKADRPDSTSDAGRYANKRSEIYGYMREWLKVGAIPNDDELITELTAPLYGFNVRDEIQLERKADMKSRGFSSPDIADALALTFAFPVMRNLFAGGMRPRPPEVEHEYDPLAKEAFA